MPHELAPMEVLEVVDALLFRANALGHDKREQTTHLRKLAIRFLETSTHVKELASATLAHKLPQ
jgi:hypothetical protein